MKTWKNFVSSYVWLFNFTFFRFFFDLHRPVVFEVMYLILSYSMLVMVLFGARFDGIFLGLSSNIVSHLLILQENFKGVIDNELELEDFITYHTKVLECCLDLFDLYRTFMFTQFIYTSSAFCMVCFAFIVVRLVWLYV